MTVLPDREKFIAGYRYTVNGRFVDYAPEEIVHLKYANPMDDFYGMGTIKAKVGSRVRWPWSPTNATCASVAPKSPA